MLYASYAEVDVTPRNGEDLSGFALREGPTQAPHDSLKCRWLVLEDEQKGERVLLGSADVLSFSRGTFGDIKDRIRLTYKDARIGLATTHTHSGPATVMLRHCGRMNRQYMADLKNKIANTAVQATESQRKSVQIVIGSSCSNWAYNRRNQHGPIDHEVLTVGFFDAAGKPVATIVNYACHPVVLGHKSNAASADYPGFLTAYMEKKTGAPCLFLNGACGDLNPVNNHSIEISEARKAGEAIGAKALEALNSATQVSNENIQWYSQKILIPVHQPASAAELEKRLDMLQERFGLSRSLFIDRIAKEIQLLKEGRYPKTVALELSLLRLGENAAILFVPGEVFTSIGLRIKAMMPVGRLLVSGFSNGSVGYLPDRQAYADGGYEPYFANFFYNFPEFEPHVEDVILSGARTLLVKANQTPTD